MSRISKYLLLVVLILFVLACNTVTQPFKDVQNLAGTAQSFTTQIPVETLQAFASEVPNFEGYFNPQGTPVSEWNGIPVMAQATAGEEFKDTNTYSFKVDATVTEVQDFYSAELEKLGWSSLFSVPGTANGAIQTFQKDNQVLTITITDVNGSVVVVLTLA